MTRVLYDRLGDPAAPPRFRDRGRRPPEAPRPRFPLPPPARPPPPAEPEPAEEAPEPDDPVNLVCVRCCTPPVQVAWSQAEGRLIHVSVIGAPVQGGPRICGGIVARRGEEWRHAFAPGIVVPCYHTGAAIAAHLVRLGRPAASGGPSWTGTALCGKTNAGRNKNWRPLHPAAAAQAEVCPACREAHALEGGR